MWCSMNKKEDINGQQEDLTSVHNEVVIRDNQNLEEFFIWLVYVLEKYLRKGIVFNFVRPIHICVISGNQTKMCI